MRQNFQGAERLFFPSVPDPSSAEGRRELLEALLENGDSKDLRTAFHDVEETELLAWLESSGARRLSTRSLRFWCLLTDRPAPDPEPFAEAVWPL